MRWKVLIRRHTFDHGTGGLPAHTRGCGGLKANPCGADKHDAKRAGVGTCPGRRRLNQAQGLSVDTRILPASEVRHGTSL